MDTQNSQKKSPRSSARSKHESAGAPAPPRPHRGEFDDPDDEYMDRSIDHVARVRAARETAQREMESFGDVSEYNVTIIQGQLKEEPVGAPQASLDFSADAAPEQQEAE